MGKTATLGAGRPLPISAEALSTPRGKADLATSPFPLTLCTEAQSENENDPPM